MSSSFLVVDWDEVGPLVLEGGAYLLIAVGLVRQWRPAYFGAFVIHGAALVVWGGGFVIGNPYAYPVAALLFAAVAVAALFGLIAASPRDRPSSAA